MLFEDKLFSYVLEICWGKNRKENASRNENNGEKLICIFKPRQIF
jgi:hypothetical protein